MKRFDFIIAGGGAAGLSLAYHLVKSPLKNRSILIIDKEVKNRNDRTWCFWSKYPTLFEPIVHRTYSHLAFLTEALQKRILLGDYCYQMIRGIDFYHFVHKELARHPNVTILQGDIERIEDGYEQVEVIAGGANYSGSWVFNSLFAKEDLIPAPEKFHYLKQHFKGWEIQTEYDVFDPNTATFFDFRTAQKGSMRFFYILPLSRRDALVEYTLFSSDLLRSEDYDVELRRYIAEVLRIDQYHINGEENGIIPMTDQPFLRRGGKRILNTGTRGGMVKPSTGYAFLRIQNDTSAIVQSLINQGDPFNIPKSPSRYKMFDSIMLQLMYRRGDEMKGIFQALFRKNPIDRIFRFLDETGSIVDNSKLMISLPALTFLHAMWKIMVMKEI
jgi:lycopene beta-cyclase